MIKFIFGDFGSKKTDKIINSIKNDTQNNISTFLIVPDQEAVQFERLSLSALPPSSQRSLEILSFSRLYERLCREYGGISYSYMTKPMRYLMMWKALKKTSSELSILASDKRKELPMEDLLISSINELKTNGIDIDALNTTAERLKDSSPALSKKLCELSCVYTAFNGFIKDKYSDSSDDLSRLNKMLESHSFFNGKSVYIDSFTSFTPVQHKILEKIFKSAASVTITVPVLKSELASIDALSIKESVNKLILSASKKEKPIFEEISDENGDNISALSYLSKNLWNLKISNSDGDDGSSKLSDALTQGAEDSITLELCATPYSEAEAVSAHVRKLLSEDDTLRCRDIAIIARDAELYRGIIDQALKKSELPFYFSESSTLLSTAAVKFILSALRIKIYGWKRDDVISHVKTGLCDIELEEGYLFEEYVNTWSINGARFSEDTWNMNPDGITDKISERGAKILSSANSVRKKIVPPLERLFLRLEAADSVDVMCKELYRFLVEVKLEEKLNDSAKKAKEFGDKKLEAETSAIYGIIINSLADIGSALKGESASTEEFISMLISVFDKTEINTIPTSIDGITIGSANMLRTSSPKYVFAIGLNEGTFPATVKDSGLFSFSDKEILSNSGLTLNSGVDLATSDELMFVRRCFSAPTKRLYALAHKAEVTGKECFHSLAFTRIKALFPSLPIHEYSESDFSYLVPAPKNAAMSLNCITDAKKSNSLRSALLPYLPEMNGVASSDFNTLSCSVGAGMLQNAGKTKKLSFNPSKFEAYVKCPFNYFCTYELDLRQKKNSEFSSDIIGQFIHFVIENVIKYYFASNREIEVTDEKINEIINDSVKFYLNSVCPAYLLASKRLKHLYARIKRLSFILARNVLTEFSQSDFYPVFFELSLSSKDNASQMFSPLKFTLKNGCTVTFNGIVDRVDIYKKPDESAIYVRVVDYKTGSKVFSLDDLEVGLNTQMLIYLYTICKSNSLKFKNALGINPESEIYPAGIVYLSSSEANTVSGNDYTDLADVESKAESKLVRSGVILNEEEVLKAMNHSLNPKFLAGSYKGKIKESTLKSMQEFDGIYEKLKDIIIRFSTELNDGNVSAKPIKQKKSPCEYCKSKPVCRNVQK